MKVILDNGHGVDTHGKRSPDGMFLEYAYTRKITKLVLTKLKRKGIEAVRLVPEENDILLRDRVKRANDICKSGGKGTILVSIHCNAMGDGEEWMPARGWSVYVAKTASEQSCRLATCLAKRAISKNVIVRYESSNQLYLKSNLYICKKTECPAVLVEYFLMDNRVDLDFMLSQEGMDCSTEIIVEGIMDYINTPDTGK